VGVPIKHRIEGIELLPKEEQKKLRSKIRGEIYRATHPEEVKARARHSSRKIKLRDNFNLTLDQYDAILRKQKGACALCGFVPSGSDTHRSGKSLAVDHDHITGQVRGLLCDLCNRGIGQLHDDSTLLRKAANYVEEASVPFFVPWGTEEVVENQNRPKPLPMGGYGRLELPLPKIIELYDSGRGLSAKEIGKLFGTTRETISRRLKQAGVRMNPRGGKRSL
jgi:hypothetical protein